MASLFRRYAEHRYTVLFVMLLTAVAGHGLVGAVLPVGNPLEWLLAVALVAVVFSARSGALRWILGGLTVGCVVARLVQGMVEHPAPLVVSQSLLAVVWALAAAIAVGRALRPGRVDAEHICAALDAYLLAGLAFGVGYWLLECAIPGSFSLASGGEFTPPRAVYFSFVTQATLGFGDIFPLGEPAQGVVVAQGMGGQMYLAVLIARLVSLYSAREEEQTP